MEEGIHQEGALSPGSIGEVVKPWYMHPAQDDNLIVLSGKRDVDIYTKAHGKVEHFTVTPDKIIKNGELLYDNPAMLVWPKYVFHRIRSCEVNGSASINFAVRYDSFDIKSAFDVYDLNTETGEYKVIRKGHLDQPDNVNNG